MFAQFPDTTIEKKSKSVQHNLLGLIPVFTASVELDINLLLKDTKIGLIAFDQTMQSHADTLRRIHISSFWLVRMDR